MLSFRRDHRDATLIERYWSALRRNRATPPPDGLDPNLADLIVEVESDLAPPALSATTIDRLWRQVENQATEAIQSGWSGPAIDPSTRRRNVAPPITEREEQPSMSDHVQPADIEPIPIQQRNWLRETLKFVAAAIIFIAIGVILSLTLRGNDDQTPAIQPDGPTPMPTVQTTATQEAIVPTSTAAPSPTATTASTTTATATATRQPFEPTPLATPQGPVAGEIVTYIPMAYEPADMAFTTDALWVSGWDSSVITRIDPVSGTVVATVDLGVINPNRSVAIGYLQPDTDGVWAYLEPERTLVKIDSASNQIVATIQLPPAFDLTGYAVTSDAIWASDYGGRVMRVNLESGIIEASIEMSSPQRTLAAFDAIWVANYDANIVTRIDPTTNQIVATIEVGSSPSYLTAGAGSIWVSNRGSESISRIDPETNQEVARFTVPLAGSNVLRVRPWVIIADDNTLWVTDESTGSALYRIDPATNAVAGTLMTPAGNVIVDEDAVWVAVFPEWVILQIAPTP